VTTDAPADQPTQDSQDSQDGQESQDGQDDRDDIAAARRVVVKVGSS